MTSNRLLLDTHVWINYQGFSKALRPAAEAALDEAVARNQVYVSVISVWEIAMLARDGKLELTGGVDRWTNDALSKPGIALLPFTPAIAIESVNLPPPMHKDPSDRILVASARTERMTLVTADKAILAFARTTGLPVMRA